MRIYILKRVILMLPTLFGIMLITFVITQFVPGGPVEHMMAKLRHTQHTQSVISANTELYRGSEGVDAKQREELIKLFGFDKPPHERFIKLLWSYLRFDFGDSYYHHNKVLDLIISKLPVSMSLGFWTFVIVYSVCIPLGVAKAVRSGTRFDTISTTVILIGYAIPGFVLGITLLVLFGGGSFFSIFPLRGIISDNWQDMSTIGKILDYLWHMVLPITSSVIGSLAILTLLTKNSFLEEINKQYVLTARAKGLSQNSVLYKHVFRNAVIPLLTSFPSAFVGAFFASSLLIETIFSLDGLGLLGYESVVQRDYPVVLASLYLFTLLGLISKLLTDLSYVWVDPRIQFESVDKR
jgi:microcin C transport system permease protein